MACRMLTSSGMRMALLAVTVLGVVAMKSNLNASSEPEGPQTRCVRVERGEVGRLPLELSLGDDTVRLEEWTQADESSTAVVGFAARLPAGVVFMVQAGDESFTGSAPRWLHPRGLVGPRVQGIEQVTFCRSLTQLAAR